MITKEQFVKLAEAIVDHQDYELDLSKSIFETAKKHGQPTDFLGLPMMCERLENAVLSMLGEDFDYWLFECERNFKKFSNNITFKDGSHPRVKNLGDLYDFAVEQGSIE